MATTRDDIKQWFESAPSDKTHMLVVCDTFDWEDYPVYTNDPIAAEKLYNGPNMQRVMEIYKLSDPLFSQLEQRRSWNF